MLDPAARLCVLEALLIQRGPVANTSVEISNMYEFKVVGRSARSIRTARRRSGNGSWVEPRRIGWGKDRCRSLPRRGIGRRNRWTEDAKFNRCGGSGSSDLHCLYARASANI